MADLSPIYAPWNGNAEAMAADIGELPVTVRQWRNRGSVPPRYWRRIIVEAEKHSYELTLELFAALAEADMAAAQVAA